MLRWSDAIARQSTWIIVAALVVAGLAGSYTIRKLHIDTSTENMISAEVSFRRHNIEYKRAFPAFRDSIVAVIDGDTPEGADRAARALSAALKADRQHFEAVDDAAQNPFFIDHGLLYLAPADLTELADRLAAAQPLLATLASDPSLSGLADFVSLLSENQKSDTLLPEEVDALFNAMAEVVEAARDDRPKDLSWQRVLFQADTAPPYRNLVIADPILDHGTFAPAASAIASIRAINERLQLDSAHGLTVRLTGPAMIDHEELESVGTSTAKASILTTIGVAILLIWGLRSLQLIVATLTMLAIGLIVTAGLATAIVGQLNLISVTFAVLFIGLGDDFGSHVALRYREGMDRGEPHRTALRKAIAGSFRPVTLTAVCAAVGFLAFVPTSYRGLAELGVISAIGMVVAWLASLTLLPAFLTALQGLAWCRLRTRPAAAASMERSRWPILILALVGALASTLALPKIAFDFNPLHLKDPASESVATLNSLADDAATSPNSIDILARDLEHATEIARALEAVPEVGQVMTLSSFVPSDQDQKLDVIDSMAFFLGPTLDVPPAPAPTPEARHAAFERLQGELHTMAHQGKGAKHLADAVDRFAGLAPSDAALGDLDRRLTGYLPDLLDRLRAALNATPVSVETLPAELRERWVNAAGQARLLVTPATRLDDNQSLARFADAVLAVVPDATGTPVVITEAGQVVVGAFIEASWIALAAITLLLVLVIRRPEDILLIYVPLLLAFLYTAATVVLFGLEFNFANVIALPLLLGLGVSGSIHVVMRQNESPPNRPVTATSTPRAIMYSALTTIASFGSLAISTHRGLASMGQLLTIAIGWSLICSLIILPCMLAVVRQRRSESP